MGLFDKMKKKNNEEVSPAVTPEVTEGVEAQNISEAPIAQDNVFNATPGELAMPPVETKTQEVPAEDIQIQNIEETVSVDSPTDIINETAATIDEPSAALGEESINVNPIAMFEDEQNKEDTITQLVSAAVNKEEAESQTANHEPAEPTIQEESIIKENPVGTIGDTVAGPQMENTVYDNQSENVVVEDVKQSQETQEQSEQNVEIKDIVSTEEAFIPEEIAESQKEVFELTSEPKKEVAEEPVLELSDLSASDMLITNEVENENNTLDEENIEQVENKEEVVEESTIVEEKNELPIEEPIISEDLSALNLEENKEEEIIEEQPPIIEEEQSSIIEPVIEDEQSTIEFEHSNEEISSNIVEDNNIEEQSNSASVEENEEITPIIENNVQDLILGEEITSLENDISEDDNIEEQTPVIEEDTSEISKDETKPIIEEEKHELFLGEEEKVEDKIVPIITEITELEIPKPIEEISEYMLDAEGNKDETIENEVTLSNEEDVAEIYADVTSPENEKKESVEPILETKEVEESEASEKAEESNPETKEITAEYTKEESTEIDNNENTEIEEKEETTTIPEEKQIETKEVEEDEPVVLPFDIFPHFDIPEEPKEPTKVEVSEPNTIYISEAPNTKFCDSCGNIITEGTSICPSCGEPID